MFLPNIPGVESLQNPGKITNHQIPTHVLIRFIPQAIIVA